MQSAPHPDDEQARLEALHSFAVLDTEPEVGFDDLTLTAATIFGAPIALVSLVDRARQWFKSCVGLDAKETPRDVAFCSHAILEPSEVLVVSNALEDERFHDNPLVAGGPSIRFYAGAPLVTSEGAALGTLCVIDSEPRTPSKEQLQALQALARQAVAQLELRRALRALREAQCDLEASAAAAHAASRAKSEFLANTSHEIRTPLHGILASLDLLRSSDLSDDQRQLLALIDTSADTLSVVIDDVLDSAKIESGRMEVERIPFDPCSVARDAVALFMQKAFEAEIHLSFQCADDAPTGILGDPVRLRQILFNLISNAIKFTHEGAVRVEISHEEGAERPLVVRVIDTGIGMSPEVQASIFESFSQAGRETTRLYGGTGLGTYIARQLTLLMSGELSVSSEVGVGSTFELRLPVELAEALPAPAPNELPELSGRILVAEDNVVNQRIVARILEQLGLEYELVENGVEAVARADESFDLVLMDVQMPNMDGIEATRRLRDRGLALPIVAATAAVQDSHVESFEGAGFDDRLSKPFKREELAQLLARHLRAAPSAH